MKTFDLKQFAEAIRQARGNKSLEESAKEIGIEKTALYRYEKMILEPKISHVILIANWMRKKVDKFIK